MEWATLPLKRYAEFSGRSRRKEYWMYTLLVIVVAIVLSVIENLLGLGGMVGPYGLLTSLFLLATLVPSIAVGIRRLHDTGRSGWWLLIALVPFVGGIVLLVFYCLEGNNGPNEYGPDPKGEDLATTFA
ncbi:MAG: hypothetical protein QOJ91_984 [Sphingomonadales bacterium]|jgi:uncharacterized membrane protein YhaH (DUF805 family)|nr:hypothetical protein [Sphingomonadales bacterium]